MWLLAAIVGAAGIGRLLGAVSAPLVFDEYQWLEVVDGISLVPGAAENGGVKLDHRAAV